MTESSETTDLPQAVLTPQRGLSWLWLLPIGMFVLSAWLGYQAWGQRGTIVTVQLDEGHGLQAADEVRYRGIAVGHVRSVALAESLDGVEVELSLQKHARDLARSGTRFWVVRPQLGVSGATGLETVIGPRYLAVLPGHGEPQHRFVGLDAPPVVERVQPGDLEIVLEARRRGGLRPGTPLLYRQVRIGTVVSVGLTSDGGAVEARVHVEKAFTQLVKVQTRFWSVAGLNVEVGLRGLSMDMDSVETLLAGGVALATPPDGGAAVRNGHRFTLDDEPDAAWLAWQPMVVIGNPFLPASATMPTPLRAVGDVSSGRWLASQHSRRGWVLQTQRGLLGPTDLLTQNAESDDSASLVLEIAGKPAAVSEPLWSGHGLTLLPWPADAGAWPTLSIRKAEHPEDCVVVGDPTGTSMPLSASRFTPEEEGRWHIDPALALDAAWHGACVLSRADGKLIGLVLVEEDRVHVALLPALP